MSPVYIQVILPQVRLTLWPFAFGAKVSEVEERIPTTLTLVGGSVQRDGVTCLINDCCLDHMGVFTFTRGSFQGSHLYEAWFVNEYLLFSISGQPQRQEEKRSYPQEFVQADRG